MRMIDADSLKERMLAETPEHEKGVVDLFLEAVAAMIDEQPTIEDRKTGKWIDETFEPWGLVYHPYKCNQCGEHSEADSNFCPNCGADMKGGQE